MSRSRTPSADAADPVQQGVDTLAMALRAMEATLRAPYEDHWAAKIVAGHSPSQLTRVLGHGTVGIASVPTCERGGSGRHGCGLRQADASLKMLNQWVSTGLEMNDLWVERSRIDQPWRAAITGHRTGLPMTMFSDVLVRKGAAKFPYGSNVPG